MISNPIRGLKAIKLFEGLKVGQEFLLISPQFNTANKVQLIKFDDTGLNRPLAYFQYIEDPKETDPFCIWQHELNNQSILFPYIF